MSLSSSLLPRRAWMLILATSLLTADALASKPTAAPVEHPGCFLLMELKTGKVTRIHPEQCSKRLAPASTFKVPHALIALETGVLSGPEEVRRWDGTKHHREDWNQDQTLDTAMRRSALWFFQGTAKQIGRERMEEWLKRLRYGNTKASGDITRFWIDGTLRITRVLSAGVRDTAILGG
jgi:beta-lactamase class D